MVASVIRLEGGLDVGGSRPDKTANGTPLAVRLRVRCRRGDLDRRIAAGDEVWDDPALRLRAEQLCLRETRGVLADTLVGVVEMSYEHPLPAESPRLDRAAIADVRPLILDLAGRLRSDPAVNPLGVAVASRLLADRSGPLYAADAAGPSLGNELRAAIAGLEL